MLGLGGVKPRDKVVNLIHAVEGLKAQCGVPVSGAAAAASAAGGRRHGAVRVIGVGGWRSRVP